MHTLPTDRRYSASHEWIKDNGDGTATVGITDHAQAALGDLVFVELPQLDQVIAAQAACAVVESVKAASDIYCPVAGTVIAVNEELSAMPELINQDAYGAGWIFQLKLANAAELNALLDAAAYQASLHDAG
ncbi:glycine cleavage system protein GcvH [Thiospirillum jenense]|uniref:Glycine cleavage system H protein n=1 Tax=Thiospirillum jenense TaxID=1653858 RepID=A0A839HCU3_9GAMM|nr:glycine cleavage system protein GcvH [Thiospirillum jenense]MBB1126334.1 glycine cleavage system protein GcvH [Thiospirillum jenense]